MVIYSAATDLTIKREGMEVISRAGFVLLGSLGYARYLVYCLYMLHDQIVVVAAEAGVLSEELNVFVIKHKLS